MRVVEGSELHAVAVDEFGMLGIEPALAHGLGIQAGAGIGGRQRYLHGVWIDLEGEANRLLDRLLRLARQAEDEGAVYGDAELPAVRAEAARDVDAHALLDVVEDLLIAGLVADQQQPQAAILQDF